MLDLAPEDKKIIRRFINDIRVLQDFDLPPVMDKLPLIPSIIRGIKMSRYRRFLFILLKQKNETNFSLSRKFKNPFLRECLRLLFDDNEVNMLVFNIPMAVFDKKSAGYPIGGSLSWAKRLEEKFISLGGKMHYNTPVQKILTENDEVKGLLVRNNVIHRCDIVLSAADWHKTIFDYLEGKYINEKIQRLKDEKSLELYYSVLLVTFGLKKIIMNNLEKMLFPH